MAIDISDLPTPKAFGAADISDLPAPSGPINVADLSEEEYLKRVGKIREQAKQPAGGRTEKPLEGKIAYSDLYTDDRNFFKVLDYGKARFGKKGELEPGESRQDYVNRWASHMRAATGTNLLDSTAELQYLNSAKREDLLKAKEAYDLFESTTGFLSASGQKGFKPLWDYITAAASSPDTALSLGVGKLAASSIAKEATNKGFQAAIKSRLAALSVPAVEATAGTLGAGVQEKIELNVTKAQLDEAKQNLAKLSAEDQQRFKPELDALEKRLKEGVRGSVLVTAGLASGLFGTLETAALLKASRTAAGKPSALSDVLSARAAKRGGPIAAPAPPPVKVKPEDPTEKILEDQYDIFEGRRLLNEEGNPTSVAEMQIRNDVNKKAAEIASGIWQRLPDLAPQQDQKISDAVKNVFMNIDNIDDVVLRDALASAGVTPEEFARMNRTTAGDAGRTLQAYSALARIQNKLKSIDPAAAKEVDLMYGNRNTLTSAFSGFYDLSLRLDRELKALMVSQVSTTIRNAFSGAAVVTLGAASEALESALYRVGKTVGELSTGKPITGSFTGGLKGVYDDAIRTIFYLGESNLSSETAERLLAGSPTLKNRILRTIGEEGDKDLSKVARVANTLNVAQDAFFRKAIFVSSVEKQLSRVGLNMYDVIEANKNIPIDVLKNATDEALVATFSKMPTKGPAFEVVKFFEWLGPIGSTVVPFPRFMVNAMSWTYKHSPMGMFSGSADVAKGATLLAKGDETGQKYLMQGLENVSKGAVGTAAIYAAYKYREENQDTNWYDIKNPDGSLVDARALFPLAPFLAIGDYLVKFKKDRTDEFKTKEFLEALTGFKAPAGTYAWLGDKFAEAMSNAQTGEGSADKKMQQFFGEWVGEYFGRALIPIQQVSDIIGVIDRDETLPRDAYQIKPGEEGFVTSASQQLMKRTPVLKQQLPEAQPALREEAVYNDSGPLKLLTGIVLKANPSPLENEVTRLKVDFNKVFTSTGDKIVDANAKKVMAPLAIQLFDSIKEQPFYAEASQDVQKIALQNLLQFAQKTSKEIATAKDEATAFNEGRQSRLYELRYAALPPEVKRATAEMYKQNTGKDLLETKDYLSALAFAAVIRKIPSFAVGGLAGKMLKPSIKAGATKSSAQLMEEMQQAAAVKAAGQKAAAAVPPPAPVVKQAAPTPAPKPIEQPVEPRVMPEETVAESSVYDFVPPETSKLDVENIPTAQVAIPNSTKVDSDDFIAKWDTSKSDKDFIETWNKEFPEATDEDFVAAFNKKEDKKYQDYKAKIQELEEAGEEIYTTEGFIQPEYEFGAMFGSTKKYSLQNKDQIIKDVYEGVDEEYAKMLKEFADEQKTTSEKKALRESDIENIPKALKGDLDLLPDVDPRDVNVKKRNSIIQTIKDARLAIYDEVMANPRFTEFDSKVIGVAIGDWRFRTGTELNPLDEEAMKSFYSMTKAYQKRYDDLVKEHADKPPIRLWHGRGKRMTADIIMSEGMLNPVTQPRFHSELKVGGPSFTKDLNLNFRNEMFGGYDPKKYVYTEIPYADYEFGRINMSPKAYDEKNLNVLARSITGNPSFIRPVSLPRSSGLKETEDVIIEAEKLIQNPKYGEPPLKRGTKEIDALLTSEIKRGPDSKIKSIKLGAEKLEESINKHRKNLSDILLDIQEKQMSGDMFESRSEKMLAYKGYDATRSLMKSLREMASYTSIGGGTGQQYHKLLASLSESLMGRSYNLNVIADLLDKAGAKEKADKMRNLQEQLSKFKDYQLTLTEKDFTRKAKKPDYQGYTDAMQQEIEAASAIERMTPKLKGGGLLQRRNKNKILTHDGYPARVNSDGSYSTELSITVSDPRLNKGKFTNIPSLWKGEEVDDDTAILNALKSGNKYPSFNSVDEAVEAAKAKSSAGGASSN